MYEKPFLLMPAIICLSLCFLSCRQGIKSSESEAWKGRYTVEVKELLRIGSEDLADDPYVFSGINDIRIDGSGNVYALDFKELKIKVFTPEGKYLRAYELHKGQGPGEFQRPLWFDIGPNGDLYVVDSDLPRITALNQTGKYVGMMTLRRRPGLIAVGRDGSIYMTGGLLDTSEYEVSKYHFPDGKLLDTFCPTNELARWIGRVGGNGEICVNPQGNVYYSFTIPYDIREFSPSGELLNRFGRKIPSWRPPRISNTGLPDSPIMSLTMGVFPDGKLLCTFLDRRTDPYVYWFDVFDKNGDWLISFDTREYIKDKYGRLVRIDSRGHVYMEFWKPFPHIRKYSIEFVPVNARGQ
jgi:hypothetical protein